jgi:polysaccharide export outer membrane protein
LSALEGESMLNYLHRNLSRASLVAAALALWAGTIGCQSPNYVPHLVPPGGSHASAPSASTTPQNTDSLLLKEGDTIHISFPGAPTLNSTQTIRRDGKISMDLVGEITASGLTPHGLEEVLLNKFADQLVLKQVSVTVQSSAFILYVTGAVQRPGELVSDRPLTPLEAVIEAGIDHDKADLKHVTIIRDAGNGQRLKFKRNLDNELRGRGTDSFALKPFDIIFVREKFSWF